MRRSTPKTCFAVALAAAALSVSGLDAKADVQGCTPYTSSDEISWDAQNVIVMVLDDTSWSEIPNLNLPIYWPNEDGPPTSYSSALEALTDADFRRPEFNRLAARAFADSTTSGCTADEPCLGETSSGYVVPVDLDAVSSATNADSFTYDVTSTSPSRHILSGFGGFGRFAREGVAFSRFYSTSAKCAPARASIMTGRYPSQVGVPKNNKGLQQDEVTIADLLSSLSGASTDTGGPVTRPYVTGFIGKWHLKEELSHTVPDRGFDEAFYYPGKARFHWDWTRLQCAPAEEQFHCTEPVSTSSGSECTSDEDCLSVSGCTTAGTCACTTETQGGTGYCYHVCDPAQSTPCSGYGGGTCSPFGSYIGSARRRVCHPDNAVEDPQCCVAKSSTVRKRPDHYEFKKKYRDGVSTKYWNRVKASNSSCDDSGTPTLIGNHGCSYDTRYYRDVARNFIRRHSPEDDDDSRFFLYIAPHALHAQNAAPEKTLAHYTTAGLRPKHSQGPEKFWGALEEVDAAIGWIMGSLDPYCEGNSSTYGNACEDNADCGSGGVCNQNTYARGNTVMFLTNDQGRANQGYGQPSLRGQKGDLYEGDVRVGLLAWGGLGETGVQIGSGDKSYLSDVVGSHVDLFATVAQAAGCKPDADGQYELKLCPGTRQFCATNQDCGGATCGTTRGLAGRTLLPDLSATVAADMNRTTPIRDYAFAQYSSAGEVVTTRQGATGVNVCGRYDTLAAGTSPSDHINRERWAGSCGLCNGETNCGVAHCQTNGSYCVPSTQTDCDTGGVNCEPELYSRCSSNADCASTNLPCRPLTVRCDSCFQGAWKLRAKKQGSTLVAKELFDLTTNAEESEAMNCVDEEQLEDLRTDLLDRLDDWWDCASDISDSQDSCEDYPVSE